MNVCEGVLRAGSGGGGCCGNEERRDVDSESTEKAENEWGINVELLDEMDKKLLKSLLNEGWRGTRRVLRREKENESCDVEDKKRARSPVNESKTRDGRSRREEEEKPGKQTSRFDRSMRVLEWLDADCGTRLARHYEQAGGWRSLPQRQQRHQRTHYPQQTQRLLGSKVIIGPDKFQGYVKDSEEDTSSSEEEKKILEETEDFLNDEDADDDDLVLALRKWQEEQLLQQEHYEDLSMQDYVTSSEDDNNNEDSDSEDELVLALKTWQEEQKRQQKLQHQQQQQQQHQLYHRQLPLAQQPPALTPVIEDKVSSPSTYEGFGYFYQDHNYLVYHYNKQRHNTHHQNQQPQQQSSGATPYWWGNISSVREGPSSPPVLVKNAESAKSCNVLTEPRRVSRTNLIRARGSSGGIATSHIGGSESSIRYGNISSGHRTTSSLLSIPTASASSAHGSNTSLHLLSPTLPISPSASSKTETTNRNYLNRDVRSPQPLSTADNELVDSQGNNCAKEQFSIKSNLSTSRCAKLPGDINLKVVNVISSPHSPVITKISGGGFNVSSYRPTTASSDKHRLTISSSTDDSLEIQLSEPHTGPDIYSKSASLTQSTASSDSGIEKSPVLSSPARKGAGLDKIGDFFKKVHHRFSTSGGSQSPTAKNTPPQTPNKQLLQQKATTNSPRRLSISNSTVPPSPLLKPPSPSPVARFVPVHAPFSATKSEPLVPSPSPKSRPGLWWKNKKARSQIQQDQEGSGDATNLAPGHLFSSRSVDSGYSGTTANSGAVNNETGDNGVISDLNSRLNRDIPPSDVDRKGVQSNNDTLVSGCVNEYKKVCVLPAAASGSSKTIIASGKETQQFFVPQNYQHQQYHHSNSALAAANRSASEINKTYGQESIDGALAGQSGSRSFSRDNLNILKKSSEALDKTSEEIENLSSGAVTSAVIYGRSYQLRTVPQIRRQSPVTEIEQKILYNDGVEKDLRGKIKTTLGVSIGEDVGSSSNIADGSSASRILEDSRQVKSMTGAKKKGSALKEEFVNSRCLEKSSSTSSEEKVTLSVPNAAHDRSRRGSHGTCNHLFLEQASGRKSPVPSKDRKSPSPSPIRGGLLKGVVNSTSTSSSTSSTESSSKHQVVGKVLSLHSPTSPPHQSSKISLKKLSNLHQPGPDSAAKNITSPEAPPTSYRGRRKFSDTGLTPVPRRLFSDGRRGSLTDEKTLVFAKSKLGKLRHQGRKSSDASSVAALVKQIHNLWGEGEEEDGDNGGCNNKNQEINTGLTCSLDDQILFDKKRKKFQISTNQDGSSASEDSKIINGSTASCENSPARLDNVSNTIVDDRGKNLTADQKTLLSSSSLSVFSQSSSNLVTAVRGDEPRHVLDKIPREDAPDTPANDHLPVADTINTAPSVGAVSGGSGPCLSGSEFVLPVAQVASRHLLLAAAVSTAACFVGIDTPESLITRAASGPSTGNAAGPNNNLTTNNSKHGKRTATVQFQPIVSWENTAEDSVAPAPRSVLKQGARRHSSFAGFSESTDDLSTLQKTSAENLSSPLNNQSKNGLPKSKTSDNYRSILKTSERPTLSSIDTVSSSQGDKKRSKSPSPKSKKNEKGFDYGSDQKNSEISLSLCLKATRSLSPKIKKSRVEARDNQESTDQSSQATPYSSTDREQCTDSGNCSLDLPTKTIGVQATPRTIGKTSNTGTQTSDLSGGGDSSTEQSSSSPPEGGGWLQRLAAKCMASVGGSSRPGVTSGATGGLPRAASVRAEWLLGNKRMGSNPSSPVAPGADASEKFWVPHDVMARKRAQSLVPTLSKQDSEEDLSSEAATPASIPHPRELAFNFPSERPGAISSGLSEPQPSTPPTNYNAGRRRASMHDAIDLTKIDTRLYDKKLVRQASVTSIEEESQGTVHVSLEHNSETGILTVNLVSAHNLMPRDLNYTANPYCRLTLLPGQRTSAQSRIHRKTLNPEFEEEFIFELTSEEVASSTLEVSFYEYDQFSKDECVGYVRIPFIGMDLGKQVDLWRSISPYDKPKDQRDLGDVMFSLSYLPSAERLTVVIVRARNLRLPDDGKVDLNPFIKVCITSGSKKLKKKKTTTAHSTNSPTWNEALVFSVHRETLKNIGLEVSAYHDNKLGIDECIGRIRLPANSVDGVHCQELLKEKSMAARWYNLT